MPDLQAVLCHQREIRTKGETKLKRARTEERERIVGKVYESLGTEDVFRWHRSPPWLKDALVRFYDAILPEGTVAVSADEDALLREFASAALAHWDVMAARGGDYLSERYDASLARFVATDRALRASGFLPLPAPQMDIPRLMVLTMESGDRLHLIGTLTDDPMGFRGKAALLEIVRPTTPEQRATIEAMAKEIGLAVAFATPSPADTEGGE